MEFIDVDKENNLVMEKGQYPCIGITKRAIGALIFELDERQDMIHALEDKIAERDEEIANLRGHIEDAKDTSRKDYND